MTSLNEEAKARKALDLARNDDLGRLAVSCLAERLKRLEANDLLRRRRIVQQRDRIRKRLLHGEQRLCFALRFLDLGKPGRLSRQNGRFLFALCDQNGGLLFCLPRPEWTHGVRARPSSASP